MLDETLEKIWNCFQRFTADRKTFDSEDVARKKFTQRFQSNKDEDLPNFHEIPDAETLEFAFRDLLDELDLTPEKEKELNAQNLEKKWAMILEQTLRKDNADRRGHALSCAEIKEQLIAYLKVFPERYSMPLAVQYIESLSISLRTESFSFVNAFLKMGGATLLVALLNESRRRAADAIAVPLLGCFRALLNSSIGRNGVLESNNIILAIAGCLDLRNAKCKIIALEILSALCLAAEGGHRAVLDALTEARTLLGERTRFQTLIDDLHRKHDRSGTGVAGTLSITDCELNANNTLTHSRDTERVRVAIMSLINALLKGGNAEQSLEFRLHLRYELLMLGIQEVIDHLRNQHGSILEDHFDLFEMLRQEDEHELLSSIDSGASSPIDFESPSGMAEALSNKLDNTIALPHLISLLQHMLMIPGDERHIHLWRLFDLILQQLSLQIAMGSLTNVDSAHFSQCPLQINMDEFISRLRTENECERLERELSEVQAELDIERRRVVELENRVSDLQDNVSLSSFSRVSDLSSSPSDPCHSPTFFNASNSTPVVKPPSFIPPPPPPPTAEQLRHGYRKESIPLKKVPKPPCQMRSLNWTPIPYNRISGTLWENIEDEKLYYKYIDLNILSENFSCASKSDEIENANAETLQRIRRKGPSYITVIDARRAQNCTIMLSKLKLSHREIRNTILSMDERKRLPKDMIEQMLKFVPSKDEICALRDAVQQHKSPIVLALADRFLYEIAQVPRYEQRLRCLLTIRTFQERLSEITSYLNAIIRASDALTENKKLKQFLAIILAIGNYINYGKRIGNVYGFTIESLCAIHNLKSVQRSDRNLMHFLVNLIEQKFPDLLKLKRELSAVYDAAKYNREEMDAEFRMLEISLREMAYELSTIEQKSSEKDDKLNNSLPPEPSTENTIATSPESLNSDALISKSLDDSATNPLTIINENKEVKQFSPGANNKDHFVPVVRTFLETARKSLREAQSLNHEMNEKFMFCAKLFGIEYDSTRKISPCDLFGAFGRCFTQFGECQQALWTEREEIERAKRQKLVRSIFTKKGGPKNRKQDFECLVNALQTGEIFSEDLTRLRTSIRINGKSPNRRKSNLQQQQNLQNSGGITTIKINTIAN